MFIGENIQFFTSYVFKQIYLEYVNSVSFRAGHECLEIKNRNQLITLCFDAETEVTKITIWGRFKQIKEGCSSNDLQRHQGWQNFYKILQICSTQYWKNICLRDPLWSY